MTVNTSIYIKMGHFVMVRGRNMDQNMDQNMEENIDESMDENIKYGQEIIGINYR